MSRLTIPKPYIWLLVLTAIAFDVSDFYTPSFGDDLAKWNGLGWHDYTCPDWSTVRFVGAHYLGCNGRILDSVGPAITFVLPKFLASLLMGLMAAAYFYAVLAASSMLRKGRVTAGFIVVALLVAVMPWWDSMWLRVCQFNYMWSTAFCVQTVVLFFNGKKTAMSVPSIIGYALVALLAAFSHEQTGVSVCAALFCYLIARRRYLTLTRRQKVLAVSLFVGAFLSVASPAIWHRVAASRSAVTLGEMLLTTLPMVLILIGTVACMSCCSQGRHLLRDLSGTSWMVFVLIALFSGAVALFSGVVGRTGWLPETAAIIALAIIVNRVGITLSRSVAAALASCAAMFVCAHYVEAARLQYKLYKEYELVLQSYVDSPDGIVCADVTFRPQFSPLVMNRAQGAPDWDDFYYLQIMAEMYRTDSVPLTLLPAAFDGHLSCIADSLSYNSVTVYAQTPSDVVEALDESGRNNYKLQMRAEGLRMVRPVVIAGDTLMWVSQPLIIDKGDHYWY